MDKGSLTLLGLIVFWTIVSYIAYGKETAFVILILGILFTAALFLSGIPLFGIFIQAAVTIGGKSLIADYFGIEPKLLLITVMMIIYLALGIHPWIVVTIASIKDMMKPIKKSS